MNHRLLKLFAAMVAGGVATPAPPAPTPPAPTPPAPTPPPPAAPLNGATFRVTSSDTGTRNFQKGESFAPGEVPSGQDVLFTGATARLVVKNRHPDGSVAFGVVVGSVATSPSGAVVSMSAGSAPASGSVRTKAMLRATGVTCTFTVVGIGTATWAANSADWENAHYTWYETDQGSCWYFRKPIGSDPHLVAWLRVRLFADGRYDLQPKIENGYFNVANPGNKDAVFKFSMNGVEKFSESVNLLHHLHFYCINGSHFSYWDAAGPAQDVWTHDSREHVESVGWFPAIDPAINYSTWQGITQPTYSPLMLGLFRLGGMSSGGGHYTIGLFPRWDVAAHVSQDEASAKTQVRMAMAYGRYALHYRNEATGLVAKPSDFSEHLNIGINPTANSGLKDAGVAITYTPEPSGPGPDEWSRSHNPAPPFAAARKTGEWWFIEQCQFQAMTGFWMNAFMRFNNEGRIHPYYLETRAVAWPMRNLFMAASITPDDHPLKSDLMTMADNNIQRFAELATNPFGLIGIGNSGASLQPWQHAFLVATFGWALAQRLGSTPTIRATLNTFFHWLGKSVVMRLGGNASNEWNVRDATGSPLGNSGIAPVINPQGPGALADNYIQITPEWNSSGLAADGSPPTFYSSPGAMINDWMRHLVQQYPHNQPDPGPLSNPGPGALRGGFHPSAEGPWGNLQMEIGYCRTFGVAGIEEGVARMKAAPGWTDLLNDAIAEKPEYFFTKANLSGGVISAPAPPPPAPIPSPPPPPAPIPSPPPPAPVPPAEYLTYAPPAGQRANINLNSLNGNPAVDPETPPYNKWWNGYYGSSILGSASGAWNWGIQAPEYGVKGAIILHGGGHGAATAQVSAVFDIHTRMWSSVGAAQNLPIDPAWAGFQFESSTGQLVNYNPATDQRSRTYLDYPYTTQYGTSYIMLNAHMYLHMEYAPPSATNGTKGSIIIGHAQWGNDPSSELPAGYGPYPSLQNHMDLNTGLISRGSTTPPHPLGPSENNAFVRDTKRNRLWEFHQQSPIAYYWDLDEPKPRARKDAYIGTVPGGPPEIGVQYRNMLYIETLDAILVNEGGSNSSNPMGCYWIDMSTGFPVLAHGQYSPPTRLMPRGGYMAGMAYSPTLNAVYFYEGRREQTCEVLQFTTTNFKTTGYSWRKESFTGPTPPGVTREELGVDAPDSQYYDVLHSAGRKWMYVEALDCFLWTHGVSPAATSIDGSSQTGTVQLWKPPGTVV